MLQYLDDTPSSSSLWCPRSSVWELRWHAPWSHSLVLTFECSRSGCWFKRGPSPCCCFGLEAPLTTLSGLGPINWYFGSRTPLIPLWGWGPVVGILSCDIIDYARGIFFSRGGHVPSLRMYILDRVPHAGTGLETQLISDCWARTRDWLPVDSHTYSHHDCDGRYPLGLWGLGGTQA